MVLDEAKLSAQDRGIYQRAAKLLGEGVDAPTFSARFFGPGGELSKLGGGREERQRVLATDLYRWLKACYTELRLWDAARFDQEIRSESGRLTVVVPRSLHAALGSEASSEGVSLSELIRLKLAVPYRQMTELLVAPGAGREGATGRRLARTQAR